MSEQRKQRLIWIDLEMTGLDPDQDEIIEMATIVTDWQLNILAEGPVIAIHVPEARLLEMDEWNLTHHRNSGLWQRVLDSQYDHAGAEWETLNFLREWVDEGSSPMCGNTICQDRRFLYRQMPELERYFHYRNLDVSTLKELARYWSPALLDGIQKKAAHLALDDIRESIEELRYYRQHMGALSGLED